MSDNGDLSVSHQQNFAKSADDLWIALGDFNGLNNWHPAVSGSELTGSGTQPGDVRVLTLADGAMITEQLQSYDSSGMSYSYSIEESPLPVKNYLSSISVQALSDDSALVTWSSTFDADGAGDEEAKAIIKGIYEAGLSSL